MEINKENLEKSLDKEEAPKMPKEMEIGFHQGALNTLAAERMELFKIIQNVEKIMGMHISRLEELGVKIQTKEKE
jgi:argininosuccinate synthase